jgi:hypothetical protein
MPTGRGRQRWQEARLGTCTAWTTIVISTRHHVRRQQQRRRNYCCPFTYTCTNKMELKHKINNNNNDFGLVISHLSEWQCLRTSSHSATCLYTPSVTTTSKPHSRMSLAYVSGVPDRVLHCEDTIPKQGGKEGGRNEGTSYDSVSVCLCVCVSVCLYVANLNVRSQRNDVMKPVCRQK